MLTQEASPLFLQGKIQKHQTFEAELAAHSNAIHTLKSTGKEMINQQNIASDKIKVSVFRVS
jgi:spectrin alpha